ncbi:hypothetical protein GCM10022239_03520 [Leifsonia bigeumensis]|uniref:Uncharacterized protein n=1 Tax=Leifsonella bigeumensis TaxID=433643 RepID=A0ABP7F5T3_9MICO
MPEQVWHHQRKGRIVGEIVRQDDTWTHIRLSEDAWADVRKRHLDPSGTVQTYRTEYLVEFEGTA